MPLDTVSLVDYQARCLERDEAIRRLRRSEEECEALERKIRELNDRLLNAKMEEFF